MIKATIDNLLKWLSIIVVFSFLFLPPFRIKSSLPAVELIDILVPVLGVVLAFRIRDLHPRKFYILVGGFAVYVFITIIANSRLGEVRDYFEIFKLLELVLN